MVSLLSTKFHEILFSSFRGVDKLCDGQDKNNMSPHQSGGRHNECETVPSLLLRGILTLVHKICISDHL